MDATASDRQETLRNTCASSGNGNDATTGVVSGVKFASKKCNVPADTALYSKRPDPGRLKKRAAKEPNPKPTRSASKMFASLLHAPCMRRGGSNECGATKPIAAGTFARRKRVSPSAGALPGKPRAKRKPERRGARAPRCEIHATVPF